MKKVGVLFLTFIYLIVASGVALNFHYCEGEMNGISLSLQKNSDDCCDEKEVAEKNCCQEKISVLKIDDSQHFSTSLKTPASKENATEPFFVKGGIQVNRIHEINLFSSINAPPNIYKNPTCLQYQILII